MIWWYPYRRLDDPNELRHRASLPHRTVLFDNQLGEETTTDTQTVARKEDWSEQSQGSDHPEHFDIQTLVAIQHRTSMSLLYPNFIGSEC